jgi:multimeric flavodoxin WrbA
MEAPVSAREIDRKRVLGIVGSPRRGGNTEILVDEVLHGAEEAGALTEKVILSELNIAPCRACNACRKTGQCVQQDDMVKLLEQMQRSQAWVLGTPVYWWGPTAQFKAFLDRWYGARRVRFEGRHVVLVVPLGGSARGARHTVGMLTDALNYLGTEIVATVLASGAHSLGAVRGHAEVLAAARRAGREAVAMSGKR